MCPSYMVTKEEEHSTRGRSPLLFEMLDGASRGGAIADGWRSTDVLHVLDLCLACKGCKGCKADCPVNVDMATYKAEFLFHHFRSRSPPGCLGGRPCVRTRPVPSSALRSSWPPPSTS